MGKAYFINKREVDPRYHVNFMINTTLKSSEVHRLHLVRNTEIKLGRELRYTTSQITKLKTSHDFQVHVGQL